MKFSEDLLPERLRNKGILPPPTTKTPVILSESKVRTLGAIFDEKE